MSIGERQKIDILTKVNSAISSELDYDTILQTSVDLIVSKMGYLAGSIFIWDEDTGIVRSKTFSKDWYTDLVNNFIEKPFESLTVNTNKDKDNLVVKTILNEEKYIDDKLSSFVCPAVKKEVAFLIQKFIGVNLVISVPLVFANKCYGAIIFVDGKSNSFEDDIDIIDAFTKQVAIAINNSISFKKINKQIKQLKNQNAELQTINSVTANVIIELEEGSVFQKIVDSIEGKLGYVSAMISFINQDTNELELISVSKNENMRKVFEIVDPAVIHYKSIITNEKKDRQTIRTILENKTIISKDFEKVFSPPIDKNILTNLLDMIDAKSVVTVPIETHEGIIGAVIFISKDMPEDISKGSIEFMEAFAHIVGVSYENKKYVEEKEMLLSQLRQQVSEMQELRRKETDMLDILAHELRTPISIIRNYFVMLARSIKPVGMKVDKFDRYVDVIKENIRREINLLETMLSSTKIDNEQVNLNFGKVSISQMVESLVETYKKEIKNKGLQLEYKHETEEKFVNADRDRLFEIISNLISNAIKYTHNGFIKINLESSEEDGKNYVLLAVEDSGEGIPEEDLPNLGRKFYRVNQHIGGVTEEDNKKFTRPGGTGLGLYVAFGLAEMMSGRIDVKSKHSVGSKFTLLLPEIKED